MTHYEEKYIVIIGETTIKIESITQEKLVKKKTRYQMHHPAGDMDMDMDIGEELVVSTDYQVTFINPNDGQFILRLNNQQYELFLMSIQKMNHHSPMPVGY